MLAQTDNPFTVDPWAFVPHPEVWLLVAFLTGAYVYMVLSLIHISEPTRPY